MIWKINNDLIDISQQSKVYTFGTLLICVVHNDIATIVSVGDSPAYLINKDNIKRVAKTRKTYQNLIDMGIFTEEQAEGYVKTLPEYMWSMFDRFIPMVVPVYSLEEIKITTGDMIVLCCDGVSDYIKPEEIKEFINPENMENSLITIMNIAKDRSINDRQQNVYDDITMVVYCH
jgi:serine/threonine protein phosphatase PrpC